MIVRFFQRKRHSEECLLFYLFNERVMFVDYATTTVISPTPTCTLLEPVAVTESLT